MKNKIILSVSHHIYLSKDERYSLHNEESIEVVGVNSPVWFYKGSTSEPAEEVFCKYILQNKKNDPDIHTTEEGYIINLPRITNDDIFEISDEVWRGMSENERHKWYEKNETPINSKRLLDLKDGGGGYMSWRQDNQIYKNNKVLYIKHFIEIKDISILENSLAF